MTASGFKVIVAGGGPVGLTAAHALEKAGIDFVLLEQRPDVVIDAGASLVLLPIGMRALTELGLQDLLDAVSTPLGRIDRLDHNSLDIGDVQWFEMMKESSGMYPRVISRHDLTKVLYNNLSTQSQSKIFPSKKLQSIDSVPDGVKVTCADGTSYSGSIVIGADGAHSRVRTMMRSLALEQKSTNVNSEDPFLTTYRALWIRIPMDSRLKPGMTCETHGRKAATQFFAGEDTAVCGMYERLEEPTRKSQRYTIADQDAMAKRWESLPLTPNGSLTLGEAYQSCIEAGIVNLEEGVVDHWSYDGRIVLAGDAAHKFTPSTGAGCNTGMIDVLTLVNGLHAALHRAQESGDTQAILSREDIAATFQAYQEQRKEIVQDACSRSGQATASATWATAVHKLMDRYIISIHTVQRLLASQSIRNMPSTPMFDFLQRRETVDVY